MAARGDIPDLPTQLHGQQWRRDRDLPGITNRLDYLQWLGVDAIWISPIFPSPMADFGYDVADYTDIEPMFGTLGDFDRLLAEAHRRDLAPTGGPPNNWLSRFGGTA